MATVAGSVLQTVPWWLLKRGRLRASSLIVMLSVLGTVTAIATIGQGIHDLALVAFPIVFIFAGLTLNRALFRVCVGLTLVAIGWLAFGETNGWFVPVPFPEDPSNLFSFIGTAILVLVAALAVDLLATNMRKNLEQARQEISHRQRAEVALHDLNATLEQRILDRTRELADANLRLSELDKMKSEFVSRIGHELRTPLTTIKTSLELLERGKPERREHYLTTLKQESDRLQMLIEDLLQVSRLSLDGLELIVGPYDVNRLISDRLVAWGEQARQRGLELQINLSPDLPLVKIDRELTVQAIGHLFRNAIDYTPAGTITLNTTTRSDAVGRWVTVSVTDTGPGIAPADLSHIFEQFYRGRAAADYKTPGVGVGLSLCREIAEKMGGRLTVDTQVGVGSTFTLWLPANLN